MPPAFNGYGGGERPSTVARDRSAAGNIFSTYGRTLQNFDNTELSIWRRHVDRENLAVANHVGNQLSTTGLSFLRSLLNLAAPLLGNTLWELTVESDPAFTFYVLAGLSTLSLALCVPLRAHLRAPAPKQVDNTPLLDGEVIDCA